MPLYVCRYLRAWDPRTRGNPAKVQLHVNEQGHGAVSEIAAGEVVIHACLRRVGYWACCDMSMSCCIELKSNPVPGHANPVCCVCCTSLAAIELACLLLCLAAGGASAGGMVVTAGADGTCRILEPRRSFALMNTINLTNFPYSMAVAGANRSAACHQGCHGGLMFADRVTITGDNTMAGDMGRI